MSHSLQDINPSEYEILIVDDNPENLKVLGNFLVDQGYDVRVSRDGAQALESVAADPPHLILLDIHMPVMDGYEACRRLKGNEDRSSIPVIFLSALGETFNKVRAFELGGADYISKPFELEEVRMRVGIHLLADRLLAENRAGFRASFEQAAVGMAHVRLDGTIIDVNERFRAMFGQERATYTGAASRDILPEAVSKWLESGIAEVRSGVLEYGPHEFPANIGEAGGALWLKITCSLVHVGSNRAPYVSVIAQDITGQRVAEAERRRMLAALEKAPDAIAMTDLGGRILYANRAYWASCGKAGAGDSAELHGLFTAPLLEGGDSLDIADELRREGAWHGRTSIALDGRNKRVEEHSVSTLDETDLQEPHVVIVSRDITSQLRLETQLRQSQKMEAIGTLAAGIAHDFNNLLAAISGFTELALDDIPPGTETSMNLREVAGAVERARELVRQILAFGRQSEFQIRSIAVADTIMEVSRLLRRTIPPTIEINCDLAEDCPPVLADATAIHQILMNLCTNAYHAMEESGGTLGIRLTHAYIAEEQLQGYEDLPPGTYARIEVSDSGHGMDEATRLRIFEPYFTTKEQAGGTGLGLATVHGIVSDMKGAIHVYSEPGMGSTFSILLPAAGEREAADAGPDADVASGKNEHVLFVDDEATICRFAEKALERLGYRATTLSNPEQALELFRGDPAAIDVIVTDEMMPAMRGSDLLAHVRAISPETPVILYSGFSGSRQSNTNPETVFDAYVMKPMVTSELSRAIRKVLDRA